MGTVKYGAEEREGKWYPEIIVEVAGANLHFTCGLGMKDVETARAIAERVYLILSGRQLGTVLHEAGTPKDLKQAIQHGMTTGGTMLAVRDNVFNHVKDFMAQRFQPAYLKADELKGAEDILLDLYSSLTKAEE